MASMAADQKEALKVLCTVNKVKFDHAEPTDFGVLTCAGCKAEVFQEDWDAHANACKGSASAKPDMRRPDARAAAGQAVFALESGLS